MSDPKPNRLLSSRAYKKARALVDSTVRSPEKLLALVADAQSRAANHRTGKLSSLMDSIAASFRLLKAYATGHYRQISFESLALLVASIIYFVMPIDVLPDFIIAYGFIDDAALLAWTFRAIADDITAFIDWEAEQKRFGENMSPCG